MNDFKVINIENTLHIGFFSVGDKPYEVYFSEIRKQQNTALTLPDDFTFPNNGMFEIAFDCIENQINNTHFARQNIGSRAVIVFRRVIETILSHYEEHHPEIYCFIASDEKLNQVYHSISSILLRQHKGFSLQRATGDKEYVIRTPNSFPEEL